MVFDLHSILTIGMSGHMGGLGHIGHIHRAGAVVTFGKMLIFALVVIVACALGAMASLSGSDYVTNRTHHASYGRAAAWVLFFAVAAVAAVGLGRLL